MSVKSHYRRPNRIEGGRGGPGRARHRTPLQTYRKLHFKREIRLSRILNHIIRLEGGFMIPESVSLEPDILTVIPLRRLVVRNPRWPTGGWPGRSTLPSREGDGVGWGSGGRR